MDWSRFFPISRSDFRGLVSPRTVILVLMVVILYQSTGIFYNLLKLQLIRMRPAPAATQVSRATTAPLRAPADAYRIVAERNLFATTTKAITDKQAPAMQQDVALLIDVKGTVAGDARFGFAILEEKTTRKQKLVKAGDLFGGAKVLRVKRNAVDVLVNGQERTLRMVEMNEGPILPPSPGRIAAVPLPAPAGGTTVIKREDIAEVMGDMGSMLRQALIRPYFNAGVPEGFLISNIRPDSLYRKMGIIDGDIIQEVNNRKIQSADDIMGLLNVIKSGSSMSLGIKRRGNEETLNYEFQ